LVVVPLFFPLFPFFLEPPIDQLYLLLILVGERFFLPKPLFLPCRTTKKSPKPLTPIRDLPMINGDGSSFGSEQPFLSRDATGLLGYGPADPFFSEKIFSPGQAFRPSRSLTSFVYLEFYQRPQKVPLPGVVLQILVFSQRIRLFETSGLAFLATRR